MSVGKDVDIFGLPRWSSGLRLSACTTGVVGSISPVCETRSHMPCGADKNLKKTKKKKRICSRQNNAPATYIKRNCVETMMRIRLA